MDVITELCYFKMSFVVHHPMITWAFENVACLNLCRIPVWDFTHSLPWYQNIYSSVSSFFSDGSCTTKIHFFFFQCLDLLKAIRATCN